MCGNVFKYKTLAISAIFLIFGYLLVPAMLVAGENSLLKLENGLEIRLYSPADILEMSTRDMDGYLYFSPGDGMRYRLVEDVLDPEIANKGDGSFHPMNADWVVDALGEVAVPGRRLRLSVNVYVLPLPRAGHLASSARGDCIFLSPGVQNIARSAAACTATHELGHVFQSRFAPVGNGREWLEYLEIRDLKDETIYSPYACRANRPIEIFAEDFRYLFGGSEACLSGKIENSEIPLPDDVTGLSDYFIALAEQGETGTQGESPLVISNFPNPFNPSTTIRVSIDRSALTREAEIDLSVYRVDGSLVRRLYRGAAQGDELSVPWDGRDERGNPVPSGVYLYAVRLAGRLATGKMLIMR